MMMNGSRLREKRTRNHIACNFHGVRAISIGIENLARKVIESSSEF